MSTPIRELSPNFVPLSAGQGIIWLLACLQSSPHPLHSCMVWVLPRWLLSIFFDPTQCFSALKLMNLLCRGFGPQYLEMITLLFLCVISLTPQLSLLQEGLPQPLPTATNYYHETLSLWCSLVLSSFWNCLLKSPFTYLSHLFVCYGLPLGMKVYCGQSLCLTGS